MIKMIAPGEADEFKSCFTPEVLARINNKQEMGIGALSDNNEPMGAVSLSISDAIEGEEGRNLILEYFFILPKYRRAGVFRSILEFIRDKVKDMKGIIVQTVVPDMENEEAVFEALGFSRLEDGNDVVSFPISGMDNSILSDEKTTMLQEDVVPLNELLPAERKTFLKAFEADLPAGLKPDNIPGKLLPDHSFVYITKKGLYGGFLLSSILEDGTLYLGSLFVKPEYSHMAIVLLSALYLQARNPKNKYKFSRIMYATASPEASRLSGKMLEWCETEVTEKHIHNYYKEL